MGRHHHRLTRGCHHHHGLSGLCWHHHGLIRLCHHHHSLTRLCRHHHHRLCGLRHYHRLSRLRRLCHHHHRLCGLRHHHRGLRAHTALRHEHHTPTHLLRSQRQRGLSVGRVGQNRLRAARAIDGLRVDHHILRRARRSRGIPSRLLRPLSRLQFG